MLNLLLLVKVGDFGRSRQLPCGNDTAILPVGFVQVASRAARLWAYVRSVDHPENGGWGTGVVEILFSELQRALNRSERSVYRYLADAKSKGFIHSYRVRHDWVRVRYCSLERIASRLGLERLGLIACFPLNDMEFAKVRCTEAQAVSLQNQSWHEMRKDWRKLAADTNRPEKILSSDTVAGGALIARGKRLVYLRSRQRPFGGSQREIAARLGVSERTVQYRLSTPWREARWLEPINKAQTAYQICEDYPLEMKKDVYRFCDDAAAKLVLMGRNLFRVGTNLYSIPEVRIRTQKYRKARYLRKLGVVAVTKATRKENERRGESTRRFKNFSLEEMQLL